MSFITVLIDTFDKDTYEHIWLCINLNFIGRMDIQIIKVIKKLFKNNNKNKYLNSLYTKYIKWIFPFTLYKENSIKL